MKPLQTYIAVVASILGGAPMVSAQPGDTQAPTALPTETSPATATTDVQVPDTTTATTDAPPTVPAAPAAEEPLDLAALGVSDPATDGTQDSLDLPVSIYGFGDFGVNAPLYGKDSIWSSLYTASNTSAFVGNLNVYLAKQLDKKWSTLMEVRFHYIPFGKGLDPADSDREVNLGSIEIERAHIDYQHHQWLNIRAGQWLTPYGIWNVDHGTPTLIGIRRPYAVGDQLFPERQTGILAFGGDYIGPVRLGYNVGVSNGRGPKDSTLDLDRNKGVTARVDLSWSHGNGTLKLGTTFYKGRYTDANKPKMDIVAGKSVPDVKVVYDEQSFGGDLQYDLGGLVVRGELIINDRAFEDPYRPANDAGVFTADTRRIGTYALLGYRIPSLSLMPYILYERYKFGDGLTYVKTANIKYFGLNWQIVPRVVAKLEYVTVSFKGLDLLEKSDLSALSSQLAWAF